MESYWDLYVAYIHKCVADNWANDVDPAHYEMEWNHFLPKCLFGDWPIGHYLTLKQHSIASALQSLALNTNCMCGWHKEYLPETLLQLAWPIYQGAARERLHKDKDTRGRSIRGVEAMKRLHANKDSFGRSLHTLRLNEKLHSNRDELGRSFIAMKCNEKAHAKKDDQGRSLLGVKSAEKLHAEKDEFGRSVHGVKCGRKTMAQRWEDPDHPELGQRSAGNLVHMQKSRGLPSGKDNRRRVS